MSSRKSNQRSAVTLRQAYTEYLASKRMCKDVRHRYKVFMEKWLSDWLDMPIVDITPDMVEERHKRLLGTPTIRGTNGKARADDVFISLAAVLRFASDRFSEWGVELIKVNPVERLTLNNAWHQKEKRTDSIPDDRLRDFCAAVSSSSTDVFRDLVMFILLTGMRHTEAAQLTWTMIDFERETVTVPPEIARFKRGYTVPISRAVMTILRNRHHGRVASSWVFPSQGSIRRTSAFSYALPPIRAKCNLNFQMSDLRRTYLATGAKLEIERPVLKALTNKPDDEITARYITPSIERMRQSTELISKALIELMDVNVGDLAKYRRYEESINSGVQQLLLPLH